MKKSKIFTTITIASTIIFLGQGLIKPIFAQTLGLSIYPPIDEIIIMPGKSVSQSFTIINDGNDGLASVYIVPFFAHGEGGNIGLDETNIVDASSPFASWFHITAPSVSFGEKFYLAGGQRQNVNITISPPEGVPEKDYYFTLMYELDGEIPGSFAPIGPTNKARIGANILISVSKDGNPSKNPDIVEFSAPKIIDSLGKLTFNVRVGNYYSYFFKTNGKITINPTFGKDEVLELAPLNVISNSVRNISCINGEELVTCQAPNKVFLGIYKSKLEITADGQGASREKTATTIAFPFSLFIAGGLIYVFYKTLGKLKNTKNRR